MVNGPSATALARRAALRAVLLTAATGCNREPTGMVHPEPRPAAMVRPTPSSVAFMTPLASRLPCRESAPLLVGGRDTGYERCASGEVHRREVRDCPVQPRAASAGKEQLPLTCRTEAECGPGERCVSFLGGPSHCQAGCTRDAECGPQQVCRCGEPVGTCVPSDCTSDASCPSGRCAQSVDVCNRPYFTCQTEDDGCTGDRDCADGLHCVQPRGEHRACGGFPCAVGRPLRVAEEERLALLQRTLWG